MGLDNVVKKLAKVAVAAVGIYAAVQLTPLIAPYYVNSKATLAVAATGGAGVGYVVANATDSKK